MSDWPSWRRNTSPLKKKGFGDQDCTLKKKRSVHLVFFFGHGVIFVAGAREHDVKNKDLRNQPGRPNLPRCTVQHTAIYSVQELNHVIHQEGNCQSHPDHRSSTSTLCSTSFCRAVNAPPKATARCFICACTPDVLSSCCVYEIVCNTPTW